MFPPLRLWRRGIALATGGTVRLPLLALLVLALANIEGGCRDVRVSPPQRVTEAHVGREVFNSTCPTEILGYATVSGSTTGGGTAAAPVTVTTLADLIQYASQTAPMIIRVKGMIAVPPASQPFQIPVGSNKTIVGADGQSGLTGGGLLINRSQNVILQNLAIALPVGTDSITVRSAKHVWIDHCELYGDRSHGTTYYGWLVDVIRGSDFVTVSWSWFHDQFTTIQVGDASRNNTADPAHPTVTVHHNLFQRTDLGEPRVRVGTVHVFNNHYQDITGYAIGSSMHARVATEENVFDNVAIPLTNKHARLNGSGGGQIGDIGNVCHPGCTNLVLDQTRGDGSMFMPSDSYSYLADSTDAVPIIVGTCAGPGRTQTPNAEAATDRLMTMEPLLLSGMVEP